MGRKFLCCGSSGDEGTPTPNRPVEESELQQQQNPSTANQKDSPASQGPKGRSDQPALHLPGTSASGPSSSVPRTSYPNGEKAGSHQDTTNSEINTAPAAMGGNEKSAGEHGPSEPAPGYSKNEKQGASGGPMSLENPPPYHNWQEAVPDTSTFPTPPRRSYLSSNTGNASRAEADRAHHFCDNTPLWSPVMPSDVVYGCVQRADLRPVIPREYSGDLGVKGNGKWKGSTRADCGDSLLLTGLPLYFAAQDSPFVTERAKTIYFEVKLVRTHSKSKSESPGFSIGYAAQPYPTWRSPGWERGSVGVFSDDGRRFVNDSWGGRELTTKFRNGETVGLGMIFSLGNQAHRMIGVSSRPKVEIFFTRNGRIAGSWDLHEPVHAKAGTLEGLEGDFDLYGAMGLFGGVEFEVCFDPQDWLWDGSW